MRREEMRRKQTKKELHVASNTKDQSTHVLFDFDPSKMGQVKKVLLIDRIYLSIYLSIYLYIYICIHVDGDCFF
jgi:hypothetical protein